MDVENRSYITAQWKYVPFEGFFPCTPANTLPELNAQYQFDAALPNKTATTRAAQAHCRGVPLYFPESSAKEFRLQDLGMQEGVRICHYSCRKHSSSFSTFVRRPKNPILPSASRIAFRWAVLLFPYNNRAQRQIAAILQDLCRWDYPLLRN